MIVFQGLSQNDNGLPAPAEMIFVVTPEGIAGADVRTRGVIRQVRDDVNAAFNTNLIPLDPPLIDATLTAALQELAKTGARAQDIANREAAAILAPLVATPESVRANLIPIARATATLGASFEPLPTPTLPGLQIRRESAVGLAGLLFFGLLVIGTGTYLWMRRA